MGLLSLQLYLCINLIYLIYLLVSFFSVITVQCNVTLTAMDDVVESPDPASTSSVSPLECTYSITVYAGYGVEIQVKCFSLGTAGIIINCSFFQRHLSLHIIQEVIT